MDYNNYGVGGTTGVGGNGNQIPIAQKIQPALAYGAGVGFSALGYSISLHRPWRTFGFWSAIVGAVFIVCWITQGLMGGAIGMVNREPLPQSAPSAMRFGNAISRGGTPVVGGAAKGIAVGLDKGVRAEYSETVERKSFYRSPRSAWEATNARR